MPHWSRCTQLSPKKLKLAQKNLNWHNSLWDWKAKSVENPDVLHWHSILDIFIAQMSFNCSSSFSGKVTDRIGWWPCLKQRPQLAVSCGTSFNYYPEYSVGFNPENLKLSANFKFGTGFFFFVCFFGCNYNMQPPVIPTLLTLHSAMKPFFWLARTRAVS